jgi:predicted DNA-binding transcriptional regulator YafY
MRRADRLFQIIQLLRNHRVTTAARLADELEVSERTVYRDICDLQASGVPIEGERGVGYIMRKGFDLPPLMFTSQELQALLLGSRVVMSWTDGPLARAAGDALQRIEAVLPENLRERMHQTQLYAPQYIIRPEKKAFFGPLHQAVEEKRKVFLTYVDGEGQNSQRTIRPLALSFWGWSWALTAWCEVRQDFRNFRLDRMDEITLLDDRFADEPGKTMEDFFRLMESEHAEMERGTRRLHFEDENRVGGGR